MLSALAFLETSLQKLNAHVAHFEQVEKTLGVNVDQRAVKRAAEYLRKQIDIVGARERQEAQSGCDDRYGPPLHLAPGHVMWYTNYRWQTLVIDTNSIFKQLEQRGFSRTQAEGITEALKELDTSKLVTKSDLEIALANQTIILIKWMTGALLAQGALGVALLEYLK